ncbi:PREDICTED: cilia- and flagella-associated protein 57 [Amphimedon queenslandica]|uniref:EML-like second beta-propeller domain-containing protein n=2 Tax=Amphimedon queenslandica TaxID=400682 RepID=A0A1X7UI28_AMPQE|nr:PREDICTED: cilia- and flagella-associated protein 57 [Amphimedon queenslandica]|eukprot:XP_019854181.1 PREDICTED: cilia- and flagella-associated protein 57 [Amphimedon queenslandica]
MSIATAQLNYSFGLKGEVSQNASYVDEQTIIYPAGRNLILFNTDQKIQRFLPFNLEGGEGASAMAVSSNRRYAAVAEKHPDRPTVTVFDLHSMRKRKVLTCPEVTATEYVSLAFSPDSKYLVGQGGGPEWTLVYWHWEKAKPMAHIKVSHNPVNQVSFNPQDNTQVCIVGEKVFKLYRYSEGAFKQFAFTKIEPQTYLCQAWLSEDRLILGTDSGKVQLFEGGDLKNEFIVSAETVATPSSNASKSSTPQTRPSIVPPLNQFPVYSLLSYTKGFMCTSGSGTVHLFEKTEEKNNFKKVRSVSIWVDPLTGISSDQSKHDIDAGSSSGCGSEGVDLEILSMAISPAEENVICNTRSRQMYVLTLSAADLGKGAAFDYLSSSFHHGAITGLDVSLRKPVIATCSMDKSVRIWNYETNTLDVAKEFQEEAYSVAIHPSGLFLLVGFSEKLRLMNVLIDDIRPFKEIMIRGCRECSFSNGGHLFAAANANLIQVYGTFSFENTANLKGHSGKVRGIIWSNDDSRLISCSMDGSVYEWNVLSSKREKECVLKNCAYTSVSMSPDLKSVYAVGSDRTLKEINLNEATVVRQMSSGDAVLTQVVLSHSGKMLFVGTTNGTIQSVKFPLVEPGEWHEHQAHSAPVARMCISYDDQFLISVGEDGTIFSFRIIDKEGRMLKRERDSNYAEEILITRSDLEEKNTTMSELRTRVEELKMENEYQLRLKDMNYNEKIKDLTDKFIQEIEALKAKNENLKTDKERLESRYEEEIHQQLESHSREVQERETTTNTKLMGEYEKYQELQARSQRLQEDYERQLQEMEDAREKALQELTEHYERKLHEKGIMLDKGADDLRKQQREAEEIQRQMEEDTDQEILALKNHYERQLHEQCDENLKLRGDTGILKKKVDSLQGEINELKGSINQLKQEVKKREGIINSLRNDIEGMKKEIQERDDTINDKEKRIYDLKKKNQELEKFKFVLDYKIKELRKQMEPRENEIRSKKEQISKMEIELSDYSRYNKELLREREQQKLKLEATTKEMMKERRQVHDLKVEIENFKCSLHGTTRHIQEPKVLKEEIKDLYKRYLKNYDESATHVDVTGEKDLHKEYARQREHMERTVASLRKKLTKDSEIHRSDTVRVMQENVSLLKEINDLRRELKTSRSIAHDFEAALKIARKNGFDDQAVLSGIRAPPPSGGIGRMEAADQTRVLELQKFEIGKLRNKVHELEAGKLPEKLPPLQAI